jgi:uncharacterized protein (TIGR02271 family)
MASEPMDRVVPLNQLPGYKVADGEPDIRGWDVVASDGHRLGKVEELLVDTQANKVRYVEVDVDGDDRHVTVPIGYARLEESRHQVLVDRMGSDQLRALPTYERGGMTRDYEEQVGRACNVTAAPAAESDYYENDAFRGDKEMRLTLSEEQLNVGKRQVEAGEVGIHKHVETQHVHENVEVRREEVEVERRPITDPLHASGQIIETEDEIRIPLHAEEVVVEKRVVPTEELVVRKREVVENEGVDATLRRETAEVDREVRTDTHLRDERLDDDRLDRR